MPPTLADLLGSHLQRARTSVNRLADISGVPQRTIANWLNGQIHKPHQWQAVVKVAQALHLAESETEALLCAAGHPSLMQLRSSAATPSDRAILASIQPSTPHPHQAPFQAIADNPNFVGRSVELEILKRALLEGGKATVCGIQGMGGTGKTTLAARLAYQLRGAFPDGVLWARLDISDSLSILGAFAEAYGRDVSQYKDVESRASVVRNLLASKRVLIILDNAETSAQVRPLLPPSTGTCAALVTTRRSLSIMDGWKRLNLIGFDEVSDDSIQLFEHYLGADVIRFHRAALSEIATLLGHLPLALAIVAGRLANGSFQSITDRGTSAVASLLDALRASHSRLDALTYDDMGVRASFDIGFMALPPSQQDLFSTLGIFSGEDFGSDATAYLMEASLETVKMDLERLHSLSLIHESRVDRWRLHPLLRDYAREKLQASGRLEFVVEKTLQMYRQAAQNEWAFSTTLDDEIPNLRFALDQASQLKLYRPLIETVKAIYPVLSAGAWFSFACAALEKAREAAGALGDQKADFHLLKGLSLMQLGLGDIKSARENLLLALQIARSTLREENVADILASLGKLEHDSGHRKQASVYLEESLALARKINNLQLVSRTLNNLAFNALSEARFNEAEKMFLDALEITRVHKSGEAPHRILMNLGELSWQTGNWEGAESYWQEALPLAKASKYRAATVVLLANMAKISARRNEWANAEELSEEAICLAQEIKSPRVESIARRELGCIFQKQKKFEKALEQLVRAKELAVEANDLETEGKALHCLGLLFLELLQFEKAYTALDAALALARKIENEIMIAEACFTKARALSADGKHAEAKRAANESLGIYKRLSLSRQEKELQDWVQTL